MKVYSTTKYPWLKETKTENIYRFKRLNKKERKLLRESELNKYFQKLLDYYSEVTDVWGTVTLLFVSISWILIAIRIILTVIQHISS